MLKPETLEEALARIVTLEALLKVYRKEADAAAARTDAMVRLLARTEMARRELEETYLLPKKDG